MAKVASLGIHILDILGRHVSRIPEGQHVDLIDEIRLTVAGTAAGTSVDLAKLGAEVYAMGAIGEDEMGNFIIDTMHRYGINTDGLVRKVGVQTSATMLPIRPNGERPALHVLGANAKYSLDDVNWDIIKNVDYLHFGGTYLLAMLDGEPTAEVLKFAKKHGVVTTLDMIALQRDDLLEIIEPALPYIDFFMPGIEEARMICKLEDRHEVIDFFLARGAKHTVFKMGAQGSSIASKDMAEIRVPAFNMNVVDSTGCGDAYCAAFIVGLSLGWSLEQAGRFASAASGLVITGLGSDAGIIDFDHTLDVMNTYDIIPMDD